MILQLSFFLNISFDKHVTFEILALLIRKNFLNLVKNQKKNYMFN